MKFCKMSVVLALFLAVCLPAFAQSEVSVKVPFEFVAAGKTLPAGQYKVTEIFTSNNISWQIRGEGTSAMVITNSIESPRAAHDPSLIFLHVGGRYLLSQIWSDPHAGREVRLPKTKQIVVAKKDSQNYVEIGAE